VPLCGHATLASAYVVAHVRYEQACRDGDEEACHFTQDPPRPMISSRRSQIE